MRMPFCMDFRDAIIDCFFYKCDLLLLSINSKQEAVQNQNVLFSALFSPFIL